MSDEIARRPIGWLTSSNGSSFGTTSYKSARPTVVSRGSSPSAIRTLMRACSSTCPLWKARETSSGSANLMPSPRAFTFSRVM